MSVNLRTLLPGFVSNITGIREILDAISAEAERLERQAENAHRQFSASTATTGLLDWERELALYRRPDLDEQSRRALVLAALCFFSPCTPQRLTALYSKMTGSAAEYAETPDEYRIELSTVTPGYVIPDLPSIYRAVSKVAPAHIYCRLEAEGDLAAMQTEHHALHATIDLHIYSAAD